MADLGAVAIARPALRRRVIVTYTAPPTGKTATPNRRTYVVFWDGLVSVTKSTVGALSGVVEESAVPLSRCMVRVYYRPSGQLIRSVLTAANGSFTVPGLDPTDTQNYFAIAFDPAGGTQYNAIIFDRLTAV